MTEPYEHCQCDNCSGVDCEGLKEIEEQNKKLIYNRGYEEGVKMALDELEGWARSDGEDENILQWVISKKLQSLGKKEATTTKPQEHEYIITESKIQQLTDLAINSFYHEDHTELWDDVRSNPVSEHDTQTRKEERGRLLKEILDWRVMCFNAYNSPKGLHYFDYKFFWKDEGKFLESLRSKEHP